MSIKKVSLLKVRLKTNYYENSLPYEQLFKGKFYAIIVIFNLFIYYKYGKILYVMK